METALNIETYLAWTDPSCERTEASYGFIPGNGAGITGALANFLFAPEKLGNLYTSYYVRDGICFSDPTPPLAAASPSDQLALVRESFGFSITRIAEVFGKCRPTIYLWMKEGTANPKVLKKLTTLASAGDYWKTKTGGVDHTWLLEQSAANSPSIMDELELVTPDLGKIIDLMDLRLSEYKAATARAKEILGEAGISRTMSKPSSLTEVQQMSDRSWTRIRENLTASSR
jgi:hypothetical protein